MGRIGPLRGDLWQWLETRTRRKLYLALAADLN